MVFSSVPLYLDPPNWQQHQNQLQGSGGNDQTQHHLLPPPMAAQPPAMGGGGGGAPGIRPNSMSERARLAKIPAPEAPLKCPRCDSTNTKFCYFNNYSLSQPRHFCKTCRRYWTRGGALRSVPVGGGCRRNKRSSSSASKSSSGTTSGGGVATSAASKPSSSLSSAGDFMGAGGFVIPPSGGGSMTSFMASLQNIAQLGMGNLGLTSFGGALHGIGGLGSSHHDQHHSQLDNFNNNGSHHGLFNHNIHQIVPSPSSFLGGFELPAGAGGNSTVGGNLYSDHQQEAVVGEEISTSKGNINPSSMVISSHSQFAPVKMEDNGQARLNLAKQLMGISSSNDNNNNNDNQGGNANQFWGANIGNATNMWTDLSGLNSSSTTHLL